MKDLINEIITLYKYFNGENYIFFAIFLISVAIIFVRENNKKIKDFFVGYTLVVFLIIWNPVCIYLLNKFINIGSMYRLYFVLPCILTIAYAFTKIVENNENKVKKFIVFSILSFTIIICGKCIFNETTLLKTSNYYKLPDEDVEVAEIIRNDTQTEYKKAMVPYGMSSRIRQVAPEIKMLYTRVVYNVKDENGNGTPTDGDDPSNYKPVQFLNEGRVQDMVECCNKNDVNYIVINKETELNGNMETYGFSFYKETQNYDIYRRNSTVIGELTQKKTL